jgi:transposase-like protein
VSRRFVAATEKQMAEWLGRDLSMLDLSVLMIDGICIADHVLLVALGRPSHDDDLDTGFLDEDFLRQTMDACRGDRTLDQIAEAINISRNTLDSWRRGRSSPTHNDHIERMARALNDREGSQSRRLALHLRVVVAAVACRRFLVEQMGAHRVEDLVVHLVGEHVVGRDQDLVRDRHRGALGAYARLEAPVTYPSSRCPWHEKLKSPPGSVPS